MYRGIGRASATYRAARRNRCRKDRRPWPGIAARYMPYSTKPPRIKWGTFHVGADGAPSLDDVQAVFTDLRKQPRTYRVGWKTYGERRRADAAFASH